MKRPIDDDQPPFGWTPTEETLRKMREASPIDLDLHLGGPAEDASGDHWLKELDEERLANAARAKEAEDLRKQLREAQRVLAEVARFHGRATVLATGKSIAPPGVDDDVAEEGAPSSVAKASK